MTFREKLKEERPYFVDNGFGGGCCGCPYKYGYEEAAPDFCRDINIDRRCWKCWDREIPGTEPTKKIGSICVGVKVKKRKGCQGVGELRPCEVDGQRCYFHRFIEEEQGVLEFHAFMKAADIEDVCRMYEEARIVPDCCGLEKLRHAYALVEFPDGAVKKVEPETVRFLDREGPNT